MTSKNEAPTLHGSCVCGAVRYQIALDLQQPTSRCNCTACTKRGWWSASAAESAFAVVAGHDQVERGPENPYFTVHRCPSCGIVVYGTVSAPEAGGPKVSINVRTLDDVDLHGVPVLWLDGLHDTWAPLGTTRHEAPAPLRPAS